MKRTFFIDFDGTITLEDTCNAMIAQFCRPGWREINERWERGELGTMDCARQTFDLMQADREQLVSFLEKMPIDPHFPDFVEMAEGRGDQIFILSDGYDLNIQTILHRHKLERLHFFANHLLDRDGQFDIESPYANAVCGRCGTCKTSLMRLLEEPGASTVYIGDGTSDQCPANYADSVLAKNGLLRYCIEIGLDFYEFKDFRDIIRYAYQSP